MRKKYVVANWKMNGSFDFANDLISSLNRGFEGKTASYTAIICPPSVYLETVGKQIASTAIELGAQNVHEQSSGAYTGEISAQMLVDAGCKWVIVGHSERRRMNAETSEQVAAKAEAALDAGLHAIVCAGETLEQRQAGQAQQVIESQLRPTLDIDGLHNYADQLVLAYEPVWAIGTGETATADTAQSMHAFIRELLDEELKDTPILYGGSVKPENADGLFSQPDIDGGLIGGASLKSEDFLPICWAMSE
jgi:triosephosphate isomerase